MAKRRAASGSGTVFRYRGKWRLQLSVKMPDGTVKRVTRDAARQSDLTVIREQLLAEARSPLVAECPTTVSQWLAEWLANGRGSWAKSTTATYRHAVDHWIKPRIGSVRIASLTTAIVRELLGQVEAEGGGLRTRKLVRETLMSACNAAVKEDRIAVNPVSRIPVPKGDRVAEICPFTDDEVRKIIEASRDSRYHAAVVLGLTLGLRGGEVAGLRKEHVDIKGRTVRIQEQIVDVWGEQSRTDPKTPHSRRTLQLPQVAVDALIAHERLMLAEGKADRDVLFPGRAGTPIRRGNFAARFWLPLLDQLGIARRGFHHCRHTFATFQLRNRVPLLTVSRMLGHSSPEVTLRFYAHYVPGDQRLAVDAVDAMLAGADPHCYQTATTRTSKSS